MRRLAFAVAFPFLFSIALLAGKNPADYPLQIQVIESHWERPADPLTRRYGTVNGWGRGNIHDGDAIRAFDFSYTANEHFPRTIGNTHYAAKWKKDGLKLELLVGEIGAPDKYHTYEIKTSMRDDVYVRGADGAVAVSQQEYKEKWAK
jgi:hypothetical protein